MKQPILKQEKDIETLVEKIDQLIQKAQQHIKTAVNLTMVYTYYEIGRNIFEQEQEGKERAEYGTYLLEEVANKLTKKYNHGYSPDNLKLMRRFYIVYSQDKIRETLFPQFADYPALPTGERFYLSWSH